MKVLMISKALAVGAYHAKLRELAAEQVHLSVVIPMRWGRDSPECVHSKDYEILVTQCRFSSGIPGSSRHHLHYYPNLDTIVSREEWDLIHIDEEPFNFVSFHAAKVASRRGRKFVFFTWQNLLKKYPPPFGLFEKKVFEGASGAIAGTAEVLKVMQRRGFSKPAEIIPQFGVDPSVFRKSDATSLRKSLGFANGFVVGYVGRIVPEKGLDTLIRSLALLPADCVLILVGSGPDKPRLESLIEELGLRRRVQWVPHVTSADIPEYMNAMDVLVLPSRTQKNWKEQFGRVLIEAMACETCVIGSNSGEIPNVVQDAGVIFTEGAEDDLARKLKRVMCDCNLRKDLRRRGRERVVRFFTQAKIAHDTFSFYQRICSMS